MPIFRLSRLASLLGLAAAGLSAGVSTGAWAQLSPSVVVAQAVNPNTPGVIPSAEQLKKGQEAARPQRSDTGEVPQPTPPRELGKPENDIRLDVSAYQIDGLADVPAATLQALTAPYVGTQRGYEDMVNAAAAITRFMQRELGYYLGYAYLPEQAPQGGVVHIAVMEGRLDQVILNWPDNMIVQREVVERHLARLKPGEILRVRDVERVVFLVNDLQGIRARFEVKAGRTPGTASLVVSPTAEARVSGKVEVDTYGSRYSGTGRFNAVGTIASPLGRGDALVLNAMSSFNGGMGFGLVSYALPLGADGLKVGTSLSKVNYKLSEDAFPVGLSGDADALNVFGLYPIVRSRNLNVFVLGSLEHKAFADRREIGLDTNKRTLDAQAGVVGDFRDNLLTGGVSTYEVNWVQGRLSYQGPQVNLPTDTPTHYNKLNLGYSRLQNLVSNRLLLYVRGKGQMTSQNLDTTERFSLGGPSGVRAFAPGEGTGDEGGLFTAELRFLPLESWFGRVSREMVLSAFYDWGRVNYRHDAAAAALTTLPGTPASAVLSGWGIGAVWDRPQSFGLRINLAWPINGDAVTDPVKRIPRAYALLSKYF
jgi:hemolysin activation/secretion protein